MKLFDRILQSWRAHMARPFVADGARVLDIGCHQGEFVKSLAQRIGSSVGFDPAVKCESTAVHRFIPEMFQQPSQFDDESFDVIVMLATLEHIPNKEPLAEECFRLLSPGGRVIITVPSLAVDGIMEWLCWLRIADGTCLEEHHGYDPKQTSAIFNQHGFELERHRTFQLGLNNLFVLRKPVATLHQRSRELVGSSACA